jgi:hypothetical protein
MKRARDGIGSFVFLVFIMKNRNFYYFSKTRSSLTDAVCAGNRQGCRLLAAVVARSEKKSGVFMCSLPETSDFRFYRGKQMRAEGRKHDRGGYIVPAVWGCS